MARPERFELPTTRFEAEYSIQLSYGRVPLILAANRADRRRSCAPRRGRTATLPGIPRPRALAQVGFGRSFQAETVAGASRARRPVPKHAVRARRAPAGRPGRR